MQLNGETIIMATKEQVKYTIQGKDYTATSIIKELSNILKRTRLDSEVEESDLDFVLEAFKAAPYYEEKTRGQQIVKVVKRKSGSYGTSCFFIYREDGTYTDISFTKMFRKDPQKDDVINALRQAIDPIISNFRKDFTPGVYEGELLEDVNLADVDHYDKTFNELAWEWIRNNGGIEALIKKVNKTEDGSTITCFIDERLNESFRAFHDQNTHLRFLPKNKNRSKKV